jgi:hypothetical protein
VTVVQVYCGFVVAPRNYSTEQHATTEAQRFFAMSLKLGRRGGVTLGRHQSADSDQPAAAGLAGI